MPTFIKNGECVDESRFVKAPDLNGRDVTVTIERLEKEMLFNERNNKMVECDIIYFVGAKKPFVANTLNLRTIRDGFGKQVRSWLGKRIVLFPTTTKVAGKVKDCIRIRPIQQQQPTTAPMTDAEKAAILAAEAKEAQ